MVQSQGRVLLSKEQKADMKAVSSAHHKKVHMAIVNEQKRTAKASEPPGESIDLRSPISPAKGDLGYQMKTNALVILRTLTWSEVETAAKVIGGIDSGVPWWQGDLLNYAEHSHGEKYSQVMESGIGVSYEVLRNRCSVCARIEPARRRPEPWVTFNHHAEVVKLAPADQDKLLKLVAKERLTIRALREEVAKIIPPESRGNRGTKQTFDEWWVGYVEKLEVDVAGIVADHAKIIWEAALEKGML